jgi:hypothetical protein
MKTILIAGAFALTTLSSFANKTSGKENVSVRVAIGFQNQFGNVDDVSWSPSVNSMFKATFMQDDQTVHAFFDQKGEYVASTIDVPKDQLPAKIKAAITKKIKDGVVTEALQLQGTDEIAYYIKVYANGAENLYKASAEGSLELLKY